MTAAAVVAVATGMPANGHATELATPPDAVAELTAKRTAYSTSWRTRDGGTLTRVESAPTRSA